MELYIELCPRGKPWYPNVGDGSDMKCSPRDDLGADLGSNRSSLIYDLGGGEETRDSCGSKMGKGAGFLGFRNSLTAGSLKFDLVALRPGML